MNYRDDPCRSRNKTRNSASAVQHQHPLFALSPQSMAPAQAPWLSSEDGSAVRGQGSHSPLNRKIELAALEFLSQLKSDKYGPTENCVQSPWQLPQWAS